MLVIPEPSLCDDPTEPGTFVVVALDPLASVSLLDDQAKREAAAMTPTKYLALVDGHATTEYGSDGLLRFSPILLLVGSGLPAPPHSWAAIPISPSPPHPETGRPAVEALTPLRWSNCHIHTLSTVTGLISSLYQHRIVGPVLSPEAYDKVTDEVIEDNSNFTVDLNEGALFHTEFVPPDICEIRRDDPLALDGEPGGRDSIITDLFAKDETPGMRINFKMWIDTSSLSELGDPDKIEGEITRLKQIEWEWAQRTVAAMSDKRPETREWLQNIADAEAPSIDLESAPPVTIEADVDSLVHPEDAVEHRFERGWALKDPNNPVPAFTLPSRSPSLSSLPSPSTDDSVALAVSALVGSAHEHCETTEPGDHPSPNASETLRLDTDKSVSTKWPSHVPVPHAGLPGTLFRHTLSAGLSTFAFVKSFTWDLVFRLRFRSR